MKILIFLSIISLNAWGAQESIQSALSRLYPNCKLKKETIYLTKPQKAKIEKLAELKLYSSIFIRYLNHCEGTTSYVDSHIVRTLNETLVLEVKKNKLNKIEVIAFYEPPEYKAPTKWINHFSGKELDSKLKLYQGVDGLTGATLTANAVLNASRRILAIDKVVNEK